MSIFFYVICSQLPVTWTPDNSNFFLFPLKARVIGSWLYIHDEHTRCDKIAAHCCQNSTFLHTLYIHLLLEVIKKWMRFPLHHYIHSQNNLLQYSAATRNNRKFPSQRGDGSILNTMSTHHTGRQIDPGIDATRHCQKWAAFVYSAAVVCSGKLLFTRFSFPQPARGRHNYIHNLLPQTSH